jgi:GT2 family glycosyltransferase
VIVVNDGLEDDTANVCKKHPSLNIKYYFAGHRNKDGVKPRNPCFANNIGIQKSSGDVVVLSNPEVYHLNSALSILLEPLRYDKKVLSIPKQMYFDPGTVVNVLNSREVSTKRHPFNRIGRVLRRMNPDEYQVCFPFLMGIWRDEIMKIGGYDEDFTGYACEDEDFVNRFLDSGFTFARTEAQIIHLYHGPRCDSGPYPERPDWVYNYELFKSRRHKIVRNEGREWGVL